MDNPKTIGFVLFRGFELLDVFGPAEAYGIHDNDGAFRLVMVAQESGPVQSAQGPSALAEYGFADCPHLDIILVPGGIGTRREVDNAVLISWLQARWVEDGKFATSSGVSAGIDMALAIIARLCGKDVAEKVAIAMEY